MRNKVVDALRRLHSGIVSLDALAREQIAPEENEVESKQRVWVMEQVEKTEEDELLSARLLRGRFVDGRTNAELAVEEGLTEKAVECRICRDIAELRQKAAEDGLMAPS